MQALEAQALCLALEEGVASVSEVREWADRWMRSAAHPDFKLMELSTAPVTADCVSILHELAGDGNKVEVAELALRHLAIAYEAKRVSPRNAANLVSRLFDEGFIPDDDAARQMAWFAEDLVLVEVGEYAPELEAQILTDFSRFLARFHRESRASAR